MNKRQLVIVGAGPAGMAAALAAADAGIKDILLIERAKFIGGILNQCIHTGFGLEYFGETLSGPEYAQRFIDKVIENENIEISTGSFVVDLKADKTITYLKPGGIETIKAGAIIMATGCRERTREMIPIHGTRPSGIFPAGLAQKMINIEGWIPGKKAIVIGSGDIGLIMARRLTLEGTKVEAVIEIMAESKGLARNVAQCLEDFDIPLYLNHRVKKIFGKDRVEGVIIEKIVGEGLASSRHREAQEFEIDCDTVLISVGLIPENELVEMAGIKLDRKTNTPITEIDGIFVCGNSYKIYDLVDSVTKDSEEVGKKAAEYLI